MHPSLGEVAVDALCMAIARPCAGASLVAHSDQGVQYASERYRRLLRERGITCSMSRCGNCWDDAPIESFFATLKRALVHQAQCRSRHEARRSRFEYAEVLYNRALRHSAPG